MNLLYWTLGEAFFRLLGGEGEVLRIATTYANTFMPGVFFVWLFNMSSATLRGSGDMVRPACVMTFVTCLHLLLSFILVRGAGPVPAMEIRGAALAMVMAFAAGWLVIVFLLRRPGRKFRLVAGSLPASALKPILKNGLLAANQSIVTIALSLLTTALLARYGEAWLAGYGIGVRLELLMVPVIFGFGSALIAITGANVGAGLRERALAIAWRGAFINAALIGAVGALNALAPEIWSGFFTDNEQVRTACELYLRIVGSFYVFFALGLCLYFASQGFGTLLIPVLGTYLRFTIVAIGGWLLIASGADTPERMFVLMAGALVAYGLFISVGLRLGPWRA